MAYEFSFQQEVPGLIVLQPISAPITAASGVFSEAPGTMYYDSILKCIYSNINGLRGSDETTLNFNITPVTAANPTVATNLMSYTVLGQSLNVVNKGLYWTGMGTYVTAAAQTPTVTIAVKLGALALMSFTSAATTASQTLVWEITGWLGVVTNGATATLEAHGSATFTTGTAGAPVYSVVIDQNTAVLSNVDLTANESLQVTGLLSTGNAGNSIIQRLFQVQNIN